MVLSGFVLFLAISTVLIVSGSRSAVVARSIKLLAGTQENISSIKPASTPKPESQGTTSAHDHAHDLFQEKCSRCHGDDGHSQTVIGKMLGAPDFTSEKWWTKEVTDERLTKSITTGREEMPAFGKKLNPEEVQSLIDYIRHFNPRKEQ